jgi:hypothetical protein
VSSANKVLAFTENDVATTSNQLFRMHVDFNVSPYRRGNPLDLNGEATFRKNAREFKLQGLPRGWNDRRYHLYL